MRILTNSRVLVTGAARRDDSILPQDTVQVRPGAGARFPFDLAAATLVFIAFGLSFYVYVYFFPFDEGVGGAPIAVRVVKELAYALFLAAALLSVRWTTSNWREWIFAPLAAMLVLVSWIHAGHTGAAPQLIENIKNVVIYVPVFWLMFRLTEDQRAALLPAMQRVFVILAAIQVAFSIGFFELGNRLWMGWMFVGWIGNPNSFALFLNLATAVPLALIAYEQDKLRTFVAMLLVGLMTYGVLHTSSGSQLLIHFALPCYCTAIFLRARQRRTVIRMVLTAVVMVAVSLGDVDWLSRSWIPARDSLFMRDDPDASISATRRLEMIGTAVAVLSKSVAEAAIGDLENADYHRLDGQPWVFLANGGMLTLLAFAVPALLVYILSLRRVRAGQNDLALHLMIVAFGGALLASRVLQYFPFNFLFFAIAGLALRPGARR